MSPNDGRFNVGDYGQTPSRAVRLPTYWGRISFTLAARWEPSMTAQISPMLAVADPAAAIDFYKRAFGAEEVWSLGEPDPMVACMSIEGAKLFLSKQSPNLDQRATRSPGSAGFTTVRIELFVDDPEQVHRRALEAGAIDAGPVEEHRHEPSGQRPSFSLLQGCVIDPSGHIWLIGRVIE